jgi:hypothetical protein
VGQEISSFFTQIFPKMRKKGKENNDLDLERVAIKSFLTSLSLTLSFN